MATQGERVGPVLEQSNPILLIDVAFVRVRTLHTRHRPAYIFSFCETDTQCISAPSLQS